MLRRKTSSKGHRTHHDDIPDSLHTPEKVCRQGSGRRSEHIQRNHSRRPYGLNNDVVQSKHYDCNDEQPRRNSPNHGDPYCFPTSKKDWVVVTSFTRSRPVGYLLEVLSWKRPSHKNTHPFGQSTLICIPGFRSGRPQVSNNITSGPQR